MRLRAALSLIALASAIPPVWSAPAAARSFSGEYSLSIKGLPVGTAELSADFQDGRYQIQLVTRATGLVRIFSDGKGSAEASGEDSPEGLLPAQYGHVWIEEGDTETVRIAFSGKDASRVELDPPIRKPARYVPVEPEHKEGVLDPASAFFWPTPNGFGPQVCDRVLPVFDGKRRFDLTLAYSRTEQFSARDGSYSGPALVCSVRYRPISGHRKKSDDVRLMAGNETMEIWMAPAPGASHVAPVTVRVGTKYGRVVLEARRFVFDRDWLPAQNPQRVSPGL